MSHDLRSRRRPYFTAALAVLAVVTIGVQLSPDLFVDRLQRNRFLSEDATRWAYRVLALAALAQAAYVCLVLFREERVERVWKEDPKLRKMSRTEVMDAVARSAAWMPLLTLIYGLTAFLMTGRRTGFWLFVALTGAQSVWSFLAAGRIGATLEFQPEYVAGGGARAPEEPQEERD